MLLSFFVVVVVVVVVVVFISYDFESVFLFTA